MPPRHKPWIKVDADTDESDKLAGLPNHNARWGWFRMMCRAKTQRRMGVFAGQAHLRQLLGTEGRYVPDMVKAGLLHVWPTDCGRCSSRMPSTRSISEADSCTSMRALASSTKRLRSLRM